jgi:MarR family transcriptional regulator for hemolysin
VCVPLPPYDFQDSVGYWVIRAARALQRALDDELARHGVTHQQWRVLVRVVAAGGGVCQAELARDLGVEPPTLAGILDRMERDGWIAREASDTDRRKKRVRLQPRAAAAWRRMAAAAQRVRARAVQGLGERRLVELRQTLERIRSNVAGVTEVAR